MMLHLPQYIISELIYEGKETFVYRAKRKGDNLPVIIKILKDGCTSYQHVAQLKHEYEIIRHLQIPYVVQAYGLETFQDRWMLIFEDFSGQPLSQLIQTKTIDVAAFLKISIALAHALGELHHLHVIHKDIKPQNILVNLVTDEVKFIDFGIATLLIREMSQIVSANGLQGTVTYMSPEQTGRMSRSIDYRTDIYSLGVTFYEMAIGAVPFQSQNLMELIHCHIARQAVPPHQINPSFPSALSAIIMKCLSKRVEQRYHSAYGLKNDLEECLKQFNNKQKNDFFVPGKNDVFDQFLLSQNLLGRDSELKILNGIYDLSCQGKKEIVLVSGPSGIGKSSLITEFQKRVGQRAGYFITGQFEQQNTSIPYSALIQAFRSLVQQILTENDAELQKWKTRFTQELGANIQIIVDIIPEIKLIVGEPPHIVRREVIEKDNKFNLVFAMFIKVFLSYASPLVIFLDNLQWADSYSLKVVQYLVSDISLKNLLIIIAYRDNESEVVNPFLAFIENAKQEGSHTTNLILGPLNQNTVNEFVGEIFCSPQEALQELSLIIYQKTRGNPFFIKELAKKLYQQEMINFDPQKQFWTWDLELIRAVKVSDNVAELMSMTIQNLASTTQSLLKVAAAIGNTFDIKVIAEVVGMTTSQVEDHLWEAWLEELIVVQQVKELGYEKDIINITYIFQHDRIQNAAYQLIPVEERNPLHLSIGRALLKIIPQKKLEDYLLSIVNQLNYALELIKNEQEREKYAELNFKAGKKLKDTAAYESARKCFSHGISLLSSSCWEKQHDLAFTLYENYAICELLVGENAKAEQIFDLILPHANSRLEKARVYCFKIVFYTQTTQHHKAIDCGVIGLKLFGIKLHFPVSSMRIFYEQFKLNCKLLLRGVENLHLLPLAIEEESIVLGKLYASLIPAAFLVDIRLWRFLLIKLLNLNLKKGLAEYSSMAFSTYAMICASQEEQKYQKGIAFMRAAMKMTDGFDSTSSLQATFVWYNAINIWNEHVNIAIPKLRILERKFFESGIIAFASLCLRFQSLHMLIKGENLERIHSELESSLQQIMKYKAVQGKKTISFVLGVCQALRGATPGLSDLDCDEWREIQSLSNPENAGFGVRFYVIAWSSFLYYLDDKYTSVLDFSTEVETIKDVFPSNPLWVVYYFYQALAVAALSSTPAGKKKYKKLLSAYSKRIEKWAKTCPANYLHKYLLFSAEVARISGNNYQAAHLYEQAISKAKENEYLHEEALAYELSGKFYLAQGNKKFASLYLLEAYYAYARWGAIGKLKQLNAKYEELLQFAKRPKSTLSSHIWHSWSTQFSAPDFPGGIPTFSIQSTENDVDITAIIQASQTISGEIVLNRLLAKLMNIAIMSAGADHAFLIFIDDERLIVQAEIEAGQKNSTLLKSVPLEEQQHRLCLPIVHYVARSKKEVLLKDALQEGNFTNDPYIILNKVPSILCLPLINRGKLTGILYLENRLSQGAFTPERLLILELLSSQMAISVENALFYATLESKVEERTVELKHKHQELESTLQKIKVMQDQLIVQEKMASLGALTAGIAHEIQNPLNFVINFSKLSMQILKNVHMEMEKPNLTENEEQHILSELVTLKTHVDTVVSQGKKTDSILRKMLSHTNYKNEELVSTDIHALLEESFHLFYKSMQVQNPAFQVTFIKNYDPTLERVEVASEEIVGVFVNIFNNAYYALVQKGQLIQDFQPVISVTTFKRAEHVEIRFRDNGVGIPQSITKNIFTPFFTTKPTKLGAGLGLSLSYDTIVKRHHGDISFISVENEFTEFVIILPLHQQETRK